MAELEGLDCEEILGDYLVSLGRYPISGSAVCTIRPVGRAVAVIVDGPNSLSTGLGLGVGVVYQLYPAYPAPNCA